MLIMKNILFIALLFFALSMCDINAQSEIRASFNLASFTPILFNADDHRVKDFSNNIMIEVNLVFSINENFFMTAVVKNPIGYYIKNVNTKLRYYIINSNSQLSAFTPNNWEYA